LGGERVRFVVELRRTPPGGVEGEVVREDSTTAERFSGWLELLRILESFERETPGNDNADDRPR
jgi:hypothetical protein